MVSSLWRLSSALNAHDRRTLPGTTQTPPGATRSHPQSVKHIENLQDHVSASGGTFGPPQTNCAHTHTHTDRIENKASSGLVQRIALSVYYTYKRVRQRSAVGSLTDWTGGGGRRASTQKVQELQNIS